MVKKDERNILFLPCKNPNIEKIKNESICKLSYSKKIKTQNDNLY